ncbi:MAG: hypothetical protein WAZ18_00230, partial [Alphaproteobacteria bacterium]
MLLVIRPAPQLPPTLEALTHAGFPALLPCPISTITHHPLTLPTNTTLILTSANGASHPALMSSHHPAVCVGPAT